MKKNQILCPFCQNCPGIDVPATHFAPQTGASAGEWDWTPVCASHAVGWWDGSDWPAGAGAPPIVLITPTGEPAPPTVGIADKVAHGLWQAKAAKEIDARKAPKKFAPILAGIKWAASSVANNLYHDKAERSAFMAKCGYQGEF